MALVTCIIPTTADRAAWLPDAIACIESQTHKDIEILIDADAGTIGEKRNRLCARAAGEFIAHFDSDDLSAPQRIAEQVKALNDSGKAVTAYTEVMAHDNRRVSVRENGAWRKTSGWWRFEPGELIGASLCYRRDWWALHRFEPVNLGEDNGFIEAALRADQAVSTGKGLDSFCIRNHSGNVSGRLVTAGNIFTELPHGGSFAQC
jgi:glycosyltransferase involved in cell wall biosynthesis